MLILDQINISIHIKHSKNEIMKKMAPNPPSPEVKCEFWFHQWEGV